MSATPMEGLAEWLRNCADDDWFATNVAIKLARWASEVEAAQAAMAEPVAWMCEFIRDDESIDRQVVLENPEGTRWADCADGDGVSPFNVTPLYTHPAPKGEAPRRTAIDDVFDDAGVKAWREPISQDPHTRAQVAAVMLATGTPEQKAEALRACGVKGPEHG